MIVALATLGAIGVAAGWHWFGFAAVLPLLYLLPCVAMMAFCMKGMGGQCDKTASGQGTQCNRQTNKQAQT